MGGLVGGVRAGLDAPEVGVDAVGGEQFVVGAAFDDGSLVEHQDLIGVSDRRQSVGDLVIPASIRSYGLPVMLLITILYFFITQNREMTWSEGMTLLVLSVLFLVNLGAFIQ